MDSKDKIKALEKLIANDQGFIKFNLGLVIAVVVLSLASSIFVFSSSIIEQSTALLGGLGKLAGALPPIIGTAIGIFPVKDYYLKKNRISSCEFLKAEYKKSRKNKNLVDEGSFSEVDKRFWTLVDNNLK